MYIAKSFNTHKNSMTYIINPDQTSAEVFRHDGTHAGTYHGTSHDTRDTFISNLEDYLRNNYQ